MTRLALAPDEPIHVLVPSRTIGEAIEALSPRCRAHRADPADGPVTGEAARAQVWVPRNGSPGIPDNGFLESLPRLRLVQLLSAGAEKFLQAFMQEGAGEHGLTLADETHDGRPA